MELSSSFIDMMAAKFDLKINKNKMKTILSKSSWGITDKAQNEQQQTI